MKPGPRSTAPGRAARAGADAVRIRVLAVHVSMGDSVLVASLGVRRRVPPPQGLSARQPDSTVDHSVIGRAPWYGGGSRPDLPLRRAPPPSFDRVACAVSRCPPPLVNSGGQPGAQSGPPLHGGAFASLSHNPRPLRCAAGSFRPGTTAAPGIQHDDPSSPAIYHLRTSAQHAAGPGVASRVASWSRQIVCCGSVLSVGRAEGARRFQGDSEFPIDAPMNRPSAGTLLLPVPITFHVKPRETRSIRRSLPLPYPTVGSVRASMVASQASRVRHCMGADRERGQSEQGRSGARCPYDTTCPDPNWRAHGITMSEPARMLRRAPRGAFTDLEAAGPTADPPGSHPGTT